MPLDIVHGIGAAAGACVCVIGMSHLWPFLSPRPGYNTMLHIVTAYLLLPLGLLIASRDLGRAGVLNVSTIFGSHFDPMLDLLASDSRYTMILIWAGFTAISFDGFGFLGFLLCIARAGSMLDVVHKGLDMLREKLEERGINVPGFTRAKAGGAD